MNISPVIHISFTLLFSGGDREAVFPQRAHIGFSSDIRGQEVRLGVKKGS